MSHWSKSLLICVGLGVAACASLPPSQPGQSPASITPVDLISRSHQLEGQHVVVRGYFTYETDTRALWENETAASDARGQRLGPTADYWAKCITVYPDAAARRFNRMPVVVTGRVAIIGNDDGRSLWTCNAVALEDAAVAAE